MITSDEVHKKFELCPLVLNILRLVESSEEREAKEAVFTFFILGTNFKRVY